MANSVFHRAKRILMRTRRKVYGLRALVPGLHRRHKYELMVGPLGFWDELQRYHLQVLRHHGLMPEHRLLDIGCGPLQGGIAFIRYLDSGRYTGIDIDPVRIDAAHEQVARHRLAVKKPRLVVSDSFGDAELDGARFDFIWASQILYYFADETMDQLLGTIARRMLPDGRFLADTFALDHYEFRFPEHAGRYVRHTPDSLSAQARKHGLKVRCLGTIGEFGYPKKLTLRSNPLYEITHAR